MKTKRRTRPSGRITLARSRLSKTVAPRLAAVFPRKRLYAQLGRALATSPAVWIEGPPGAGKTTLAASWLDTRKRTPLWYQVDSSDRDVASFFHYLGLAVAQTAPRYRRPLPKLTPEYRGDLAAFARNFFRELGRRLAPGTVLVFDDLHELGSDAFESMHEGLAALPDGVRAILLSRSAPPEVFARSRLEGRLAVIDWQSLQLQEAESVALVEFLERRRRSTVAETARNLHGECNGWLAGLLLLLEGAAAARPAHGSFDAVSAQRLFDYFAGEVFNRRDAGAKGFLMETALFPSFTAEMAEELTGRAGARLVLSDLVRHNHFIERRMETNAVYQYHPLFRTFLVERGKAEWRDDDLVRRKSLAAGILERAGQLEEALALRLNCGDAAAAARLILAQAPALCAAGRFESLGAAMSRLPAAAIAQEPWLVYWRAVSAALFDPVAGERDFSLAYERFEERGDAAGAWLAWAGVVDAIWYQQRDWTRLDAWIARLEQRLERDAGFPSDEIASRVVPSLFWTLHWRAPHHPGVARWEREAARLWDRSDDPSVRLRLGLVLQYHHSFAADAPRFAILTEMQRRLAKHKEVAPTDVLSACQADVLAFCLACAPAADTVKRTQEALDLASACGVHAFDATLCGSVLYSVLTAEDLPGADAWLETFHAMIGSLPTNLDTALYQVHCSWRARLGSEPARAVGLAQTALDIARGVGAYYPELICRHALAHAYLEAGDLVRAREENLGAKASAAAAHGHWCVYFCSLLDAVLAFADGDDALGAERLREALRLQERFDMSCYLPFWSKKRIEQLCLKAFELGLATPYVHKLLTAYDIRPADPPIHAEGWPFPVKVYALGRFSLLRDGKPVRVAGKAQKKPLELLKVLIALGGREVREDRVTEALWPGAEGDTAAQALATTVHRLRKLMGERAIQRREGRLSLDAGHCWVDAWALERQVTALEKADGADAGRIARGAERLLELYRGPLLAGEPDPPWMLGARDRLRSKFLRALEAAGMTLGKAGEHDAAIRCFSKGIEVDPLAENLYRCLIRCCLALGRKAEAASAYRRCQEMLRAHLGIPPSSETEALYRQTAINAPPRSVPDL